jgi:PAS domain S-box-containing protein
MPWFRPPDRQRPLAVPWMVVAFAVGALLLLLAALAYLKAQAVDGGQRLTQSLADVIGEQTSRTLQTVDERLRTAGARVADLQSERPGDSDAGRAVLREEKQGLPFVHSFWVVDAEGRVVQNSEPGGVGLAIADREYFQVHKRNPATGFFVGPPLVGRITGTWIMTASRPLPAPPGEFRGIVVAALDPNYFQQLWRSIDLGDEGLVALFRHDGRLMLRSPPDNSVLGRDYSNMPLFTEHLPRRPSGVFMSQSPVDRVARVSAYRQLPEFPGLVVLVGSSYDSMLAEWQRFALLTLLVWAAAAVGVGMLGEQLRRQLRRTRESESRFRQLAQAMPQIVVTCDARGAVTFVNQRWAEATGRDVKTALGAGWRDLLHPDDRESARETLAHALAAGQEAQHEHRLLYRDGVYRWQLLRAVPVRDEQGAIVSWYGTSTDIHALKAAQVSLKSQADLLRMAGRLARMGGWEADLTSQRLYFSDEAAAIIDLDPGDTPHLDAILELLAPRFRDTARHAVDACIVHGTPFDLEVEMVTPRGRHVWVRSIGHPVRDEEGHVVRLQGAQQDITQRVRLMEQIRELNVSLEQKIVQRTSELARQEALFRTLAEQAPLPIWTVDPEGAVTFLSRAFYDLVGSEPPRWHGYQWLELVHPDDRADVQARWARSRETGEPYTGTRRLRAHDGTYHTMTYRATPVRTAAGAVEFWVGVDTDITELMANEAALRLANEQLEAFSYSVSHDLRSPLQRIASFAQLLQEQLPDPLAPRALHYLARIRANVDHMGQLIEGLLALAQVSQVDMVRTPVDLSQMAAEILDRLQAEEPARSVAWQVDPGLAVLGDVRLMRSVLDNLLSNAWKFTSRVEHATIHVGFDAELGEYYVRDNGAGFDMMFADRLFGTFQRLHRQDEFPGTGIGLATVARAISRQGGRIRAESQPGHGATFYFTLPPVTR